MEKTDDSVNPASKGKNVADGKTVEQEKWHLPAKFLTPEALKAADEEQKRLAALSDQAFGQRSPMETERARAAKQVEHLRQTLAHLSIEKHSGDPRRRLDIIRTRQALNHQLAEVLAVTGRYDLAAEVEPDPVYAKHYASVLEAVMRDDDEWCQCGDRHGSGTRADLTLPAQVVEREIFDMRTQAPAFLLKCSKCGTRNAVPHLPEALRQQRAHRARAQQLVSGLPPEEAAKTLLAAKHTTTQLLKK